MHPARAKAREIAVLETIAQAQELILANQEQILAKLDALGVAATAQAPTTHE